MTAKQPRCWTGHGFDVHYNRLSGGLWPVRLVVVIRRHRYLLGVPVCWHVFDEYEMPFLGIMGTRLTYSALGPDRWGVAMALYMIGFISYGATLVFYAAAFPRLARNTAHSRELRRKYEANEISHEEYEIEESMEKNRISNISTVRILLF